MRSKVKAMNNVLQSIVKGQRPVFLFLNISRGHLDINHLWHWSPSFLKYYLILINIPVCYN
jgi:hypothetical protein